MSDNTLEFDFFGFRYSAARGLERDGRPIPLPRKPQGLLELLLRAEGGVVSKTDIAETLWRRAAVSDNSIDRCSHTLRKTLRAHLGCDMIETVYGGGLRLRRPVACRSNDAASGGGACVGDNPAVLELQRTAQGLIQRRSARALEGAVSALQHAAEIDPSHAPTLALLADTVAAQAMRGFVAPKFAAAEIDRLTTRALSAAPGCPAALATRGWATGALRGRPADGLHMIDQTLAVDPGNWLGRFYRAWILAAQRRLEEANREVAAGLAISPLERALLILRAWLLLCAGRTAEADAYAADRLADRPDIDMLYVLRAIAASLDGRTADAIALAARATDLSERDPIALSVLAYAQARTGDARKAEIYLDEAGVGSRQYPPLIFVASVRLACGNADAALALLRSGGVTDCPWSGFAWCDPRLRDLVPLEPQMAAGGGMALASVLPL